jgi:hypothetical protein
MIRFARGAKCGRFGASGLVAASSSRRSDAADARVAIEAKATEPNPHAAKRSMSRRLKATGRRLLQRSDMTFSFRRSEV